MAERNLRGQQPELRSTLRLQPRAQVTSTYVQPQKQRVESPEARQYMEVAEAFRQLAPGLDKLLGAQVEEYAVQQSLAGSEAVSQMTADDYRTLASKGWKALSRKYPELRDANPLLQMAIEENAGAKLGRMSGQALLDKVEALSDPLEYVDDDRITAEVNLAMQGPGNMTAAMRRGYVNQMNQYTPVFEQNVFTARNNKRKQLRDDQYKGDVTDTFDGRPEDAIADIAVLSDSYYQERGESGREIVAVAYAEWFETALKEAKSSKEVDSIVAKGEKLARLLKDMTIGNVRLSADATIKNAIDTLREGMNVVGAQRKESILQEENRLRNTVETNARNTIRDYLYRDPDAATDLRTDRDVIQDVVSTSAANGHPISVMQAETMLRETRDKFEAATKDPDAQDRAFRTLYMKHMAGTLKQEDVDKAADDAVINQAGWQRLTDALARGSQPKQRAAETIQQTFTDYLKAENLYASADPDNQSAEFQSVAKYNQWIVQPADPESDTGETHYDVLSQMHLNAAEELEKIAADPDRDYGRESERITQKLRSDVEAYIDEHTTPYLRLQAGRDLVGVMLQERIGKDKETGVAIYQARLGPDNSMTWDDMLMITGKGREELLDEFLVYSFGSDGEFFGKTPEEVQDMPKAQVRSAFNAWMSSNDEYGNAYQEYVAVTAQQDKESASARFRIPTVNVYDPAFGVQKPKDSDLAAKRSEGYMDMIPHTPSGSRGRKLSEADRAELDSALKNVQEYAVFPANGEYDPSKNYAARLRDIAELMNMSWSMNIANGSVLIGEGNVLKPNPNDKMGAGPMQPGLGGFRPFMIDTILTTAALGKVNPDHVRKGKVPVYQSEEAQYYVNIDSHKGNVKRQLDRLFHPTNCLYFDPEDEDVAQQMSDVLFDDAKFIAYFQGTPGFNQALEPQYRRSVIERQFAMMAKFPGVVTTELMQARATYYEEQQ